MLITLYNIKVSGHLIIATFSKHTALYNVFLSHYYNFYCKRPKPDMFWYNNATVHKVRSVKTLLVRFGMEEFKCPEIPDLNHNERH